MTGRKQNYFRHTSIVLVNLISVCLYSHFISWNFSWSIFTLRSQPPLSPTLLLSSSCLLSITQTFLLSLRALAVFCLFCFLLAHSAWRALTQPDATRVKRQSRASTWKRGKKSLSVVLELLVFLSFWGEKCPMKAWRMRRNIKEIFVIPLLTHF